jgi:hypothetical protein
MVKNRNVVLIVASHMLRKMLLAVLLAPLFVFGSAVFAQEAVEEEERWLDLPFEVSGNYRADYWGRWNTDDGDDQQLFQYLRLNFIDVVPDKVSIYFSGRLTAELDGGDDGDDFFHDIYDTFSGDLNGRIYYLYADIKDPLFERSTLRLGHQNSYEGESIFFTGAKYEQTIDRLRFYLQGGVWASHYQSTDADDQTIGGLGLDYQALRNTLIGYDYLRVVDDPLDDDYHSFNILQRFGSLKGFGQLSLLNSEPDDLNLYGTYYHQPLDLNLTARYYALLSERGRLTNEFSALFDLNDFDTDDDDTLGTLFPFHLVNLSLYKGWGERFATSGGFETRWMDDSDEKNEFNREYDRYFVTLELWDFLLKGLTTAFTFEYWDINGGEDSIGAGVDVEKDMNARLNVGGGFFFSRYRLRSRFIGETFSEEFETPEAYARVRYKLRENVELLAKYLIEHEDDFGTTHEVRLGVSVDF